MGSVTIPSNQIHLWRNVTTAPSSQTTAVSHNALPRRPEDDDGGFLLDDTTDWVLQLITIVILGILCGLFGTVTNLINIVVFIKQGLFSGGSVINLFFLAVADLGVTLTYFLHGIGFAVIVARLPDLPVEPFSIVYLFCGWPHIIFVKINRILTAYVAFERCMCVVIPFKVKNIFAPRRSLVYLILCFAYGFLSHVPVYVNDRLGEVKQEGTNVTKIDLVFTENREFWHDLVYYGNFLALSFLTMVIVIVCTVVTSAYVNTSKAWRNRVSGGGAAGGDNQTDDSTKTTKSDNKNYDKNTNTTTTKKATVDKEARLVKMITAISAIFCICYIPEVALIIIRTVDPRINTTGQFPRLSRILYGLTFLSAAINSSINIFVYYRMSSKYKQILSSYLFKNQEKL